MTIDEIRKEVERLRMEIKDVREEIKQAREDMRNEIAVVKMILGRSIRDDMDEPYP